MGPRFGGLLGRILFYLGSVWRPSGALKTAKNVERVIDFKVFRFFICAKFQDPSWDRFGASLGPKMEPKSGPTRDQKLEGDYRALIWHEMNQVRAYWNPQSVNLS